MKFKLLLIAAMIVSFAPACSSNKPAEDAVPVAAGPEASSLQDQAPAMPAPPVEAPIKKKTKKVKVKKEVSDKDFTK